MNKLNSYLNFANRCEHIEGISLISENRKYYHDEQLYDKQYNIEASDYLAGEGLASLIRKEKIDLRCPVLELGCGTGRLSTGLLKHFAPAEVIVTDASMDFLRIARKKFDSNGLSNYSLALLRFEDISLLPDNAFSLVVLRSALHHVIDYESFINEVSGKLIHGGAMAFQEPCYEGFLVLGLLAKMVISKGIFPNRRTSDDIKLLADTMKFYCRRDIDKSLAEDKHVFKVSDILLSAERSGMSLKYFVNKDFEFFVNETDSFHYLNFVESYLRHCMQFSEAVTEFFLRESAETLKYLSEISGRTNWPESSGVFLLKRGTD